MGVSKYDWDTLKREYMVSDDLSVAAFCRSKNLPAPRTNSYTAKKVAGWTREKKKLKQKAFDDYKKMSTDEAVFDNKAIRLKQAKIATEIIHKSTQFLKQKATKIKSVDAARKLLETGIKIQRDALGLSDKVNKDKGLTQINVYMSKFGKLFKDIDEQGTTELLKAIKNIRRERTTSDRKQIEGTVGQTTGGEVTKLSRVD